MGKKALFYAVMILGIGTLPWETTRSFPSIADPGAPRSFFFTARKLGVPLLRATIRIDEAAEEDGKRLYRVFAEVRSLEAFRLLFRMNNRFTAVLEADRYVPLQYVKEIDQGGLFFPKKRYHQVLHFEPAHQRVVVEDEGNGEKREIALPPNTYDPLSMFGRCYLKEDLQPGQEIPMSIFDGLKLRRMVFRPVKETVVLRGEEQEAICLLSSTSFSTFGEKEGSLRICYSADGRKTPLTLEVSLPVGTVKFELDEAE